MTYSVVCYCVRLVIPNNCIVEGCKIVPYEKKTSLRCSQIFKTKYYPQLYAVDIERVLTNNLGITKINKDV